MTREWWLVRLAERADRGSRLAVILVVPLLFIFRHLPDWIALRVVPPLPAAAASEPAP